MSGLGLIDLLNMSSFKWTIDCVGVQLVYCEKRSQVVCLGLSGETYLGEI